MKKQIIERTMFYGAKPNIFEKAKSLRNNMTIAEKIFWKELNANKIKGYRFKAQHPVNRYIVDFYCHKAKLVIEIDGNIHDNEEVKERDDGRTYEIENYGLKVIRFTNNQVLNNIEEVINEIKNNL